MKLCLDPARIFKWRISGAVNVAVYARRVGRQLVVKFLATLENPLQLKFLLKVLRFVLYGRDAFPTSPVLNTNMDHIFSISSVHLHH